MMTDRAEYPRMQAGHVWLVGAGPGDPGLLTLHAVHALGEADVVVYDALVDRQCLLMARPDAILEYAGKRGGKPSPKQQDISLRLVELAKQGNRVLRLKGGDPFTFGRGGEEALVLVKHGIPFRVVPGVTSGSAALAYAGIPVTHRDINHSVTFLTGHDAGGVVPDRIDWEAVSRGSPVIVMYMAMKHIGAIATRLMAAGRPSDEPVAVICNGTLKNQQVLVSRLADCEADIAKSDLKPPTIVVVGDAVRLRDGLDWLGALGGRELDSDPLGNTKLPGTGRSGR